MIDCGSVFRLLFIRCVARETGWNWLCWCQLGGICGSRQRWFAVPVQGYGGYLEGQGLRGRVSSNAADGWGRFILWELFRVGLDGGALGRVS